MGEGIFLQSPKAAGLIVQLGFFPKDTDQVALLRHAVGLLLAIGQGQEEGAELGELGHEGPDLHPTPTDANLTYLLDRDLDGSLEGEPLRVGGAGGGLYGNAGLVHRCSFFLRGVVASIATEILYQQYIRKFHTLSVEMFLFQSMYTIFLTPAFFNKL